VNSYTFTREQARNFLLLKQGLIGRHKFDGEKGVCEYIRQAGCIQFDPIDVCGKNAELVLQSRVRGFNKEMLYQLLYEDRKLIDYFDKNMSIFDVRDWKYFSRIREKHSHMAKNRKDIDSVSDKVINIVKEKKVVCSKDIDLPQIVNWSWNPTRLSRAVLETLYFSGDLILHHKKGTIKYYALASELIEESILNAPDPNESDDEFLKWRVLRRIGAVGLLWNKPSDAWLGIGGFQSKTRDRIFSQLLSEGRIVACLVDGIADRLYFLKEDEPLAKSVLLPGQYSKRLEFIAPLDSMLWDRNLIKALFDFEYKWEIYTPADQRKYGYYVLPVLFGNRLVGRIECKVDKRARQLNICNFWSEDHIGLTPDFYTNLKERLLHFAHFNQCETFSTIFSFPPLTGSPAR
jgi:uncharacterized protein YcaQ